MDHKLAETSQSVEKYALDELSQDERAQFEEHMFDCPTCSDMVRRNFTVTENLKQVLRQQPLEHRLSWRDWLRLPSLVPTFAALALAVGYQFVGSGPAELAQVLPQVTALKPTSRGTVESIQVNAQSKYFVLPVNADQLAAGSFAFELDHSVHGKGQKSADVSLIQVQLQTKILAPGRHTLKLVSDAMPADPITYTFEVQESK